MGLFRQRPAVGIGIDLGTSSVKIVELARGKAGVQLTTYAIARQSNLLSDGDTPDGVARAAVLLRAMMQRAGVKNSDVSAALPILSVFSTVLELPVMPEKELAPAVTLMAKSYVPSPLADVVLGWSPIGPPEDLRAPGAAREVAPVIGHTPAPGPMRTPQSAQNVLVTGTERAPETRKMQEVFLTAAPRDLVDRYMGLFERLNLRIGALEIESFPLARSLIRGDRRPILLVDFGDRTTSFSIVERGYLRINQAIDIGGEALTAAIARTLSLSVEQAEQRKRTEGLAGVSGADAGASGDAASIGAILRPLVMDIVTRAEVVRRLYERKHNRAIAAVQLIGGGAWLPQLATFWTNVTGLPCEVGNPWRGIAAPSPLTGHLQRLGPSFAVAVGLALRPFEQG